MDSTGQRRQTSVHKDRQFITGKEIKPGDFLQDHIYSQALDALVIACVDVIPLHNGHILIGRRSWEPQPDWWCFGGRMRKGELYQIAAVRNVKRELFHGIDDIEIDPDRFVLAGVYNLIWDRRAQDPVENGCHMLSVTMMLSLTNAEVASLHPNEEYHDIRWILPNDLLNAPSAYHPCLVQMTRDIVERSAMTT